MADKIRVSLKIGEVSPQRKVKGNNGEVPVLDFLAVNPAGQALKYGVFAKSELFPYVKTGETIDAEITETPRNDGQGVNRNVTNIYVDGKPVSQPRSGDYHGKSLESLREELRAKARNTALMQAVELAKIWTRLKTADDVLDVAEALDVWLNRTPLVKALKTEKAGEATTQTSKTSPDAKPMSETTGLEQDQGKIPEFKTGVELANYAIAHGMKAEKFKEVAKVKNPIDIQDVKAAAAVVIPLLSK